MKNSTPSLSSSYSFTKKTAPSEQETYSSNFQRLQAQKVDIELTELLGQNLLKPRKQAIQRIVAYGINY